MDTQHSSSLDYSGKGIQDALKIEALELGKELCKGRALLAATSIQPIHAK